MAPDKKDKKRKAPAVSDPPAKKTKKVEAKAAAPKPAPKKEKAAEKPTVPKVDSSDKANGQSVRKAKPRKRAADFLSDEEKDEPAAPAPQKKASNKKTKKEDGSAATPKEPADKASKPVKPASKAEKVEEVADEFNEDDEDAFDESAEGADEDEADGEDDQTALLLKGFESSGDEEDSGDEGYKEGQPIPKIPDSKKAQKKIMKQQKAAEGAKEEPGTVYIGRIPHGFYEHQMRAYFSQFGEITRLRLSRNRLTGRSKHYAFVEFSSVSVAKIVAETMDNYLMYGHILKCKYVPQEQLHSEVWKGANRRFKRTPWNRIEKKRLEKGKTRDQWSKRIEQEEKKRQAKADKLKAIGYKFDMPQLKSVDNVPVQQAPEAIEAAATETPVEEPVKAIDAPATTEDTPKKAKKGKKSDQETPKPIEAPVEATETKSKKKSKKTKAKA
ncbi:hypothetical protein N7492_002910 [Penicillium capsulatum]|uniref:RRM domain-containing protein n=1 Tax=Penicillium capsulatum TaxID=69766 RepID=A0A9W9IMK1_9EURO|nr:hypothetical protein N7492_002910 [Penicillium capsulatum]KAJ6122496.1 hypothetical protein N7512_004961 [Penicillium capsulatum]